MIYASEQTKAVIMAHKASPAALIFHSILLFFVN